jgi:hypothetical protein
MSELNRKEIRKAIEQTAKIRENDPLKQYLPIGKTIDDVVELLHKQHLNTGVKGGHQHRPGLWFSHLLARYGERDLTIVYSRSLNQIDLWSAPLKGGIWHIVTFEKSRTIEIWEDLPHPTIDWEELKIGLEAIALISDLLPNWQYHLERVKDIPRYYEA